MSVAYSSEWRQDQCVAIGIELELNLLLNMSSAEPRGSFC
jgi:hypothetical protein